MRERARNRRQYELTILKHNLVAAMSGAVFCIAGFGYLFVFSALIDAVSHVDSVADDLTGRGSLYSPIVPLILSSLALAFGWSIYRNNREIADAIPYVPPVNRQPDELPAEDVLVRSSSEPSILTQELLRAARSRDVEPSCTLLRSSKGGGSDFHVR